MKQSIIILLICFLFTSSFACSCNDAGNFKQVSKSSSLVAIVKVLAYEDFFSIPPFDTINRPMSIRVEVTKILQGKEDKREVKIFGDNGYLCRTSILGMKPGQYFIVALYRAENKTWEYGVKETDNDFILSSCGEYYLYFDPVQQMVLGRIMDKRKKSKWMHIQTLEVGLKEQSISVKLA